MVQDFFVSQRSLSFSLMRFPAAPWAGHFGFSRADSWKDLLHFPHINAHHSQSFNQSEEKACSDFYTCLSCIRTITPYACLSFWCLQMCNGSALAWCRFLRTRIASMAFVFHNVSVRDESICQGRCSYSVHHIKAMWCRFGDPKAVNKAPGEKARRNSHAANIVVWKTVLSCFQ